MLPPYLLLSVQTPPDPREALLAHLDGLFALAQVVTMNAEDAVRLVEATYARAYAGLAAGAPLPDDPKTWLYSLLIEASAEPEERPAPEVDAPVAPASPVHDDFRRRLAEQFVQQALPAAFATLPPESRLLLMLCHVQQLSGDDASRILGLPPDEASRRLETARLDLQEALYDNATEVERHLLATSLREGWERAALVQMARTELAPLPSTLRPGAIEAEAPEPAEVEPPAAVPPPEPLAEPEPNATEPEPAPADAGLSWTRLATRLTATILLIMVAGLMGYAFSGLLREKPETNLLTLSVERTGPTDVAVETSRAGQAEGYVRERLGWRLVLPSIEAATLVGVDVREITDGVEVPVFVYLDAASQQVITLYAYSYALLDRHAGRIRLERDVLHQIEDDGNFDLYDLGEERVLIWRHRDDIFVAVTPSGVADLRERIAFPS